MSGRAAAVRLPQGRCLTDVWHSLPEKQQQQWARIVDREARAVRLEAKAARDAQRHPWDLTRITAELAAQKRDGITRQLDLLRALTGPDEPGIDPGPARRSRRRPAPAEEVA